MNATLLKIQLQSEEDIIGSMDHSSPETEDERLLEESVAFNARLAEEFLNYIPASFRHAARELEFEKVFLLHIRLTHTTLGKQALVTELSPKSDPLAIDRSLGEIHEMRLFIESGDEPSLSGLLIFLRRFASSKFLAVRCLPRRARVFLRR